MSAEYAATIAPELDRIRIAISRGAAATMGPIVAEFGLSAATAPVLAMLRNLAPTRRTTRAAIADVFIYQDSAWSNALDALGDIGLIEASATEVALTPRGVSAIDRLSEAMAFFAASWDEAGVDFSARLALTAKAIDAAWTTAGQAFSVMAPVYDQPHHPLSLRFAESLTPLRFHRFDAHIAAWRAAGLTLEAVNALEGGPLKDAIEADTNTRAGAPYAALAEAERRALLDGLRSLPTPIVAV
jgi:hypothetical protein